MALRSQTILVLLVCGIFLLAALPLFASPLQTPSTTIVISQIYGAGGNSNATYQNDFIELFNRGTAPVPLDGWSVQYASATGSSWSRTDLAGTISPGQYFLIKQGSGGANGAPLPTADMTGTLTLSASAGKIALVNITTTLTISCPLSNPNVVDFVGYGNTANCYEGAAPAPVSSNNANSTQRYTFGCTETDSNSTDFATGAVRPRNSASPAFSCALTAENLLITEALYDGTQSDDGDEFVEIANPLAYSVSLIGYKIGDEETRSGGEGMYEFPFAATIAPNQVIVVARNAAQFRARFGFDPDYELVTSGGALTDTLTVPNLEKYSVWGSGSLSLSDSGDEILLLGPSDQIVDSMAWGSQGNFAAAGVRGYVIASEPRSLQRYGARDTNNMSLDFLRGAPSSGALVLPPAPPTPIPGAAMPNGM
ncbi:MAG: lamin tail domain-containing protein, partial [Anaerolineales bacterium]|nr:lamin tail domain-containing protein [Anaerolineales bacterium]